jgi:hypothetical protein
MRKRILSLLVLAALAAGSCWAWQTGAGSLVAQSALVKGMVNGMKGAFIALGGLERVSPGSQPIPVWPRHRADPSLGNPLNDVFALQLSAPINPENVL